jgi:hypothetical protein
MKRKFFTLLLSALVCTYVMAQSVRPTAVIQKAGDVKPIIDGKIDDVWAGVTKNNITLPFQQVAPATLGAEGTTYWKAVYDDAGIYILVVVNDDIWYTWFGNPDTWWYFDRVFLFFDTNPTLADGNGGHEDSKNGHLELAMGPVEGKLDGTMISVNRNAGIVNYAYNVTDPAYTTEWFVPWESIPDKDGNNFNKAATMGFDVEMSDNDNDGLDRKRAMWSNDGTRGTAVENWQNMDEAGWVTFEGAENIFIEGLDVTASVETITEDNGTIQFTAALTPANATQPYKWVITGGTGEASIDKTGLLKAVRNGTVDVQAASYDGFVTSNVVTVTITNQVVTIFEANYIKDGDFTEGVGTTPSAFWYNSPALVEDGVLTISNPTAKANPWDYMVTQTINIPEADKDLPYVLHAKLWADADCIFDMDVENTGGGYVRFGATDDPHSPDGKSQWRFDLTTVPTNYTIQIQNFSAMDMANPVQHFNLFAGMSISTVYVDSVYLVKKSDLTAIKELKSNTMSVYPNPVGNASELTVTLTSLNAKVSIFNSLGQKLMEKTANGNLVKFSVASLQRGVYFVRLDDGTTQKFVR